MRHDEFEDLFRELYIPAYTVARRILGDAQESEDAASEAMARTSASWRRVRDLPYQRAWVLRVTANVAVDMLRRRPSPGALGTGYVGVVGAAEVEDRLLLARSLRRLPRRQREVLVLRYLADLTEQQVAEQLCISQGAVKQHCRRGLTSLRGMFDPTGGISFA